MVLLTNNARCLAMLVRETCLENVTNLLHGSSRIKTPVTEFPKLASSTGRYAHIVLQRHKGLPRLGENISHVHLLQ